ncbi:hypothetical protein [Microbacterium aurugineum]|uniref:hypothetical protein n=1 Tax=Microbacterium aurugineum TaxID=2851642 RepID=UPI0020BFBA0F|nr:hypothetical protein [Microbacterium aurugineum]MCK8477243.1 hypothetical protein [Microbacterium aurugineum]
MAVRISNAVRSAAADAIVDLVDAGSGAGTLKIYTGSQPAGPGTAPSGTLLGTLTMSDPAFGAASNGVATAAAITGDTSADASGTAGWARIADSSGTAVLDMSVTATGGGGDLTLDSVSIVAGGAINVTSLTVTMPAG